MRSIGVGKSGDVEVRRPTSDVLSSSPPSPPLLFSRHHVPSLSSPSSPSTLHPLFFDIYQTGSKEAIEKERARLKDGMNRGYLADMSDLKKHGGEIAVANKTLIPAMEAVKFPGLSVEFSDGRNLQLPLGSDTKDDNADNVPAPPACLAMIESWATPFLYAFSASRVVIIYKYRFFLGSL